MLIGKHHVNQLANNQEYDWYIKGHAAYTPNPQLIQQLKESWSSELELVVFAGSWCPDTHRQLPGFFKVIQEAGIPEKQVALYFLDRSKVSGTGAEQQHQINRVPTFVVLRNGQEIGRINERSPLPPEQELLQIIQ